jgi:lipoyl-dependent peroxiredoxin
MKTLFTAEAVSKGGRPGTIQTPDRLLNVTLGNPSEKGAEARGPSPELLFAGAYSACYHDALTNAAKKLGTPVMDSTVRALVSLIEDDQGGYRLAVELYARLPGIDPAEAQCIMDEAHKSCPYSKALRGDSSVKLMVDSPATPARRVRRRAPTQFQSGVTPDTNIPLRDLTSGNPAVCGNTFAVTLTANENKQQTESYTL